MYNDPFNKVILDIPYFKISYWSVFHYFYYFLFAYFFNNMFILFFFGVLWELIEDLASKFTKKKKSLNKKHTVVNQDKTISYTNWWAGSFQDIIVNSLGLSHGYMIKNIKYFNILNLFISLYFYNLCIMKLYPVIEKKYKYLTTKYNMFSRMFLIFQWIINPNIMFLILVPSNYLVLYIGLQLIFIYFIV